MCVNSVKSLVKDAKPKRFGKRKTTFMQLIKDFFKSIN